MKGQRSKVAGLRSQGAAADMASRQWRDAWGRAMGPVLRVVAGDPWPAHHNGGQLRQRRHDGRWAKVDRGAMLPPKWKAARKRKRMGAGEALQQTLAPSQAAIEQFGRDVAAAIAWMQENGYGVRVGDAR